MNREFDAQVANKIVGCTFERSALSPTVACHLTMLNGKVVSAIGADEAGAHRRAFDRARSFEDYLLHERQYERELGILGDRFAPDRPYLVAADGPYHAVHDAPEAA